MSHPSTPRQPAMEHTIKPLAREPHPSGNGTPPVGPAPVPPDVPAQLTPLGMVAGGGPAPHPPPKLIPTISIKEAGAQPVIQHVKALAHTDSPPASVVAMAAGDTAVGGIGATTAVIRPAKIHQVGIASPGVAQGAVGTLHLDSGGTGQVIRPGTAFMTVKGGAVRGSDGAAAKVGGGAVIRPVVGGAGGSPALARVTGGDSGPPMAAKFMQNFSTVVQQNAAVHGTGNPNQASLPLNLTKGPQVGVTGPTAKLSIKPKQNITQGISVSGGVTTPGGIIGGATVPITGAGGQLNPTMASIIRAAPQAGGAVGGAIGAITGTAFTSPKVAGVQKVNVQTVGVGVPARGAAMLTQQPGSTVGTVIQTPAQKIIAANSSTVATIRGPVGGVGGVASTTALPNIPQHVADFNPIEVRPSGASTQSSLVAGGALARSTNTVQITVHQQSKGGPATGTVGAATPSAPGPTVGSVQLTALPRPLQPMHKQGVAMATGVTPVAAGAGVTIGGLTAGQLPTSRLKTMVIPQVSVGGAGGLAQTSGFHNQPLSISGTAVVAKPLSGTVAGAKATPGSLPTYIRPQQRATSGQHDYSRATDFPRKAGGVGQSTGSLPTAAIVSADTNRANTSGHFQSQLPGFTAYPQQAAFSPQHFASTSVLSTVTGTPVTASRVLTAKQPVTYSTVQAISAPSATSTASSGPQDLSQKSSSSMPSGSSTHTVSGASPRPSILRKRPMESGTVSRKLLTVGPDNVASSGNDANTPSYPNSPKLPLTIDNKDTASQSSTDTALSNDTGHADRTVSRMDTSGPSSSAAPASQQARKRPNPMENGILSLASAANHVATTDAPSPRKKPRKQLLNTVAKTDYREVDSSTEEETETKTGLLASAAAGRGSGRQDDGEDADVDDDIDEDEGDEYEDNDDAASDGDTPEKRPREEFTDKDGHRWVMMRPRRPDALLSTYKCNWNARSKHFTTHAEVKVKEESRPTLSELSSQVKVVQRANGWKIYHISDQLTEMRQAEDSFLHMFQHGKKKVTKASASVSSAGGGGVAHHLHLHPHHAAAAAASHSASELNRISELVKDNEQRCTAVGSDLTLGQTNLLESLNRHKPKMLELINKHASKRSVKRKERL